jgi:protein O-GlcNAc transferase
LNIAQAIALALRHHQEGRLDEAQELYRQVLDAAPGHSTALHLLGVIAHRRGELDRAEELIRAAILHDPSYAEAHNNLGNLLRDRGRMDEALAAHRAALAINAGDHETLFSLGVTYQAAERPNEAGEAYLQALTLNPSYGGAWVNLGNILAGQGRGKEALACFSRAIEISPGSAEAHYNLARLLQQVGEGKAAADHYRRALESDPCLVEAWYNLGTLCLEQEQVDEAVAHLQRALELKPSDTDALNNLAKALKARGDMEGALEAYRRALELQPDDREIFSNLLLALNYVPTAGAEAIFALHRDYAARFEEPQRTRWQPHANLRDPERRLRIAYLSPDFRRHPVANFIQPVLRCHDRRHFEVWCYDTYGVADDLTMQLKSLSDRWQDVAALTDEALAARIREDGIDILVDLSGHTAGNRLGTFARKPAPVQATWLGYLNTTGLAAMDWRLTDERADPPGLNDAFYSEALAYLPHSQWCYHPFDGMPEPSPLPAKKNSHVTFGAFGQVAKISGEILDVWARVLREVEGARLLLVGVPEGWARQRIIAAFRRHGVEGERLDFRGKLSLDGYWAAFAEADIALDTFPYNGGTTTCDALWLGLPVVTLSGIRAASRGGCSILAALGRPEWIAATMDEFVRIARGLARDVESLEQTRKTLRQWMEASPLGNEKEFTLGLERAYRQMWRKWCQEGLKR